jgi:hypothetical protein
MIHSQATMSLVLPAGASMPSGCSAWTIAENGPTQHLDHQRNKRYPERYPRATQDDDHLASYG